MQIYLWVAAGGALGAVARFAVGAQAAAWFGPGFPWGTLIVNVLGGLVMGFLAATLAEADKSLRAFLLVGVLGGFTTFSAFSLEALRLFEQSAFVSAFSYITASVALSILACFAGLALGRGLA
jgi:fluoride exporter